MDGPLIPSEEQIHDLYGQAEKDLRAKRERYFRWVQELENPRSLVGRQGYQTNPARFTRPSFRSQYFNLGNGPKTIASNGTAILASLTVPALHSGVLTGFSQQFIGCEDDVVNQVTWGIRINGFMPQGFPDFQGEFSSLALPHSFYFPLVGGANTLGHSFVSPGGSSNIDSNEVPTIIFQATNYSDTSIVLQGRIIGYTFPDAERADEFSSI